MGRFGSDRFTRAMVVWTVGLGLFAVALAAEAIFSLYRADQACFFGYPNVACPAGGDPAVARLTFAFFGVPAIWLVGMFAAAIARRLRRG